MTVTDDWFVTQRLPFWPHTLYRLPVQALLIWRARDVMKSPWIGKMKEWIHLFAKIGSKYKVN